MKLDLTDPERILEEGRKWHLPETRFKFLNDHVGLRRGKMHVLLGLQGAGKSTLTRSVQLDLAAKARVLVYSSEETRQDTEYMMVLRRKTSGDVAKLAFLHENEVGETEEEFFRALTLACLNHQADVLFIDNLTTSRFYDGDVRRQAPLVSRLRKELQILDIPCFIVAHTGKNVSDRKLISGDDVRGNSILTNGAEYLYVYERIVGTTSGTVVPMTGFVRVKKARMHGNVENIYMLAYDHDKSEYYGDIRVPFNDFHKAWKERQKL